MKQNCWEYKACGRQPGGNKIGEFSVCPAAIEYRTNSINGGNNGGRCCWVFTGTLCDGIVQSSFTQKVNRCFECDFYRLVKKEEESSFYPTSEIFAVLK